MSLHDNINRDSYQTSKTVQNTHDRMSGIISYYLIDSVSDDVDTEATNGTATDCLTTSVPSHNQTAILESGQEQGVLTTAGEPTETLDSVSREEDKDCGSEEDVSTCEVLNTHSEKYTQIRHTFCRVKVEINTNVSGTCCSSIIKVLCLE